MSDDRVATLQEVFEYLQDVARQSRRIIEDAVEALRKETECYFEHMRAWDYVTKPNDHFLETRFGTPRAWVTYVPRENLLAALFYIQFYGKPPVVPALMYGSLDLGKRSIDKIDRWAPFNTIRDVERSRKGIKAEQDPPFSIVTSRRKDCFSEARLVRVPLESITSWENLQRIVVKPLVALVRGDVEEARALLQEIETIQWPIGFAGTEEQEEDVEKT